jgi:hypothetical protein
MAYNTSTVKKISETSLDAFREICVEVRAEKSKYVVRGS